MMRLSAAVLMSVVALSAVSGATGCRRDKDKGAVTPKPAGPPPENLVATGAVTALSRVTADPLTEEWPSLSPDETSLLFHTISVNAAGQEVLGIVGVDPNTGAKRTLYTNPKSSSGFPSWLPDGSSFVYSTDTMGAPAIVRALSSAPNSGVAVAVSGQIAPEPAQPDVSPDGKRVAFRTFMTGQDQIAIAGLDGSNLTILGEGAAPQWHPNGEQLVFSRKVGDFQQIFLINANTGTGLTQLTNETSNNMFPCWAPDGRHIAFSSDRAGRLALYTIRPNGTVVTSLTEGTKNATNPHWGTDGFIYFTSDAGGGWDIWRFRPVGELQIGGAPAPDAAGGEPAPAGTKPAGTKPTGGGCTKDNECKGDRICVKGDCVAP